jgi:hypothetical protein
LIPISPATHYELYSDWQKALAFCRTLPDVAPPGPVRFHMLWREERGLFRRRRHFGRKQALPLKAFFATQDLSRCSLTMWSDRDLSQNDWIKPFAARMTFRVYDPAVEARGTPIEHLPAVYAQRDRRVWRDGDLFRVLILHNYGGVYVDMDMVLLRSLGVFLNQEFVYQWDRYDDDYNGALMHGCRGSAFLRELIEGVQAIPPGNTNWGRENLRRAFARGRGVSVFPAAFFDTEWQAGQRFRPFTRTPASGDLYHGAFAWHWHNHWDDRIEPGSRFQLFEALTEKTLAERALAS